MNAQRVIDHLAVSIAEELSLGGDARSCARASFSALQEDGIAVVELPAHSVNGEDDAQWVTESHTITQGFSGEVVIDDRLGIDGCELATVGAAIMAAAARYVPAVAAEKAGE